MSKKVKKPKTPTQIKRKYKVLAKVCDFGQWGSLIAPFVTIGLINFNDYFVQYDGWKISIAGIMAAFVMGITVFTIVTKKVNLAYGPLIIKTAIFVAILFLIDKVIDDLKFIMLFTLVGLIGAQTLESESDNLEKKAKRIEEGIELAEKELVRDAYKQEVKEREEKKVRF